MSNKKSCFLGIDTSNYTTSFAVCDGEGAVIANLKRLLDVKEGERGLRQSDAVFSHIKNFPEMTDSIKESLCGYEIKAVGVSVRPRDAEGSYMPCFMTGKAVAEVLAASHGVQIYSFSHQSGHIMAALYSSGAMHLLQKDKFIAYHVSGGTTEAVLVTVGENGFSTEIIAETADISAGQAIDRAGVFLGLKFPCGVELEKLASSFVGKTPKTRVCVRDGRCNLSGVENTAQKLFEQSGDKALVAAYVLEHIARTLEAMTEHIKGRYPDAPIVFAGGVMGNKMLQSRLSKYGETYFAEPSFSSDNAAGIALLTKKKFDLV